MKEDCQMANAARRVSALLTVMENNRTTRWRILRAEDGPAGIHYIGVLVEKKEYDTGTPAHLTADRSTVKCVIRPEHERHQ